MFRTSCCVSSIYKVPSAGRYRLPVSVDPRRIDLILARVLGLEQVCGENHRGVVPRYQEAR